MRSTGKAQRKSLDLLQSLIALGGHDVATSVVIGNLWPSPDGDPGRAVASTLYRSRKRLGPDDALSRGDGELATGGGVAGRGRAGWAGPRWRLGHA